MNDHDITRDDLDAEDGSSVPYHRTAVIHLEAECGSDLEDYIRKRLRDDPDSIRIVERCWVDLIRKWQRQGQLVRPRALLFRLAQYRVIDWIRHTSRRPELLEADQRVLDDIATALRSSSEFVSTVVVHVDVHAALAELPARQRQALLFTYGYGLSYTDTAALMACSVHTVGNLLRSGKENLKKSPHLAGHGVSAPSSPPEVNK